jgi:hypothetical protein
VTWPAARFRLCGAALLVLTPLRAPAQRAVADTVFIVPGSHLDVGFTAPINTVRDRRIAIIDAAIAAARQDPAFVWFEEGGWSVEAWLDHYHNQPARIAELRTLVQQHRFGIGATMLSAYAAGFPEVLPLLTMHLDRVQRELGVRPTVAVVNDVPAIPEAFVDMLASAGIHALLMAPNLVFSAPLPGTVTQSPFYWQTARGSRVLVSLDTNGYSAAITRWWLPPECARALGPREFPANASNASILATGVTNELRLHAAFTPLGIVQQALDNGTPECAEMLPAALRAWNNYSTAARLIASTPATYFRHLGTRLGGRLPVHRGEWGADWDLLRMSEPVWSWRLRQAMARVNARSPYDLQLAAVTVADHNVGLGPRWMDGVSTADAEAHVTQVAALYRELVQRTGGTAALTSVPPALHVVNAATWPASWLQISGTRSGAARVRAGSAFLFPFVPDDAAIVPAPMQVTADSDHLLIHTRIDRLALERQLGTRYQATIEVALHAPMSALHIAPDNSVDGRAGRWLLGAPPTHLVAPEGVRIDGPGWTIHAHGPLLIGWSLTADARNPQVTWLQALAVVHAVEGTVTGGQHLRLPFAEAYPGEPATPAFDLELDRLVR